MFKIIKNWYRKSKVYAVIYLIILALTLTFWQIALHTCGFTHEIFSHLFAEFITLFFTVVIIENVLKLQQRKLRKLFRGDIERLNFNFNYFISNLKGFEDVDYDILIDQTIKMEDSFIEFIEKSNKVLKKLKLDEIKEALKNVDTDNIKDFVDYIAEINPLLNEVIGRYGRIIDANEQAELLTIRRELGWLRNNLRKLANPRLQDKASSINAASNCIFDLIEKIAKLYEYK